MCAGMNKIGKVQPIWSAVEESDLHLRITGSSAKASSARKEIYMITHFRAMKFVVANYTPFGATFNLFVS